MNRILFALAVCTLGVASPLAAAQASPERLPLTGQPAIEVEAPSGWNVSRDAEGNLYLIAPDHSGGVVINMAAADGVDAVALDDMAAQALVVAKADPFTSKEPASIAGLPGEAYHSREAGTVNLRMVMVKVDASHLLAATELRADNITPAQDQLIGGVIGRIHLVGR